MKRIITSAKTALNETVLRAQVALFSGMLAAGNVMAQVTPLDLTKDTSGGKKLDDVMQNVSRTGQVGAGLLVQLAALVGLIVVIISLAVLWKASKDEREKPTSAIVGLFVGGAFAAVGTIMWIMKSTLI